VVSIFNQLAKFIVDVTTGQLEPPDPNAGKNPAARQSGSIGGKKGGKARTDKLSPSERKAIAKKAAAARWRK
jgi:hypothetical protein